MFWFKILTTQHFFNILFDIKLDGSMFIKVQCAEVHLKVQPIFRVNKLFNFMENTIIYVLPMYWPIGLYSSITRGFGSGKGVLTGRMNVHGINSFDFFSVV